MYTKRILITCCLLFILSATVFGSGFTINDINGIWLKKSYIDYLNDPNRWKRLPEDDRPERLLIAHGVIDDQYTIIVDPKTKAGEFYTGPECNAMVINEFSNNRITLCVGFRANIIVLEFITKDLLKVISWPYYSKEDYLCRIYDPALKPATKGTINNRNVRFRAFPELSGNIWFNLDYKEKVEILGISEEKQIIGDLEAYWYKVRITHKGFEDFQNGRNKIDGWVFGAYVDVDDKEALEEKLRKKNESN